MHASSILTLHDAVELFLQLASEYLNVGKPQVEFMNYWDLLNQKLPDSGLSQKESMRRLNKSRVGFKHNGTMPSRLDMEAFRASATNFFEENTPLVFGLEFASLSLVDLVAYESARNELSAAQRKLEANNIEEALSHCCLAFYCLVDDYEDRNRRRLGLSAFSPHRIESLTRHAGDIAELRNFITGLQYVFCSIEDSVRILTLGIDYQKYMKFKMLTPTATRMVGGNYDLKWERGRKKAFSREHAEYCLSFVIETALTLQQVDFERI